MIPLVEEGTRVKKGFDFWSAAVLAPAERLPSEATQKRKRIRLRDREGPTIVKSDVGKGKQSGDAVRAIAIPQKYLLLHSRTARAEVRPSASRPAT